MKDTIAAIATAPGQAGIAVVRISGARCFEITDKLLRCPPPYPSKRPGGTFVQGKIFDSNGEKIDEVIALIFRNPHSYTREDVVEIQGHGGRVCASRILKAVLDAGARLAEPGEFTKRAFLSGRLDLTQAEAVADLIAAQSDISAKMAIRQLDGDTSSLIRRCYDYIVDVASDLEATLDFPDEEIPEGIMIDAVPRLREADAVLEKLLGTARAGRIIREGALVVIAGRPNSGKSTLMNTLLDNDRAIVSPHPGTTRDTIEETLLIGGVPVRLVDTAGIRAGACDIESEGIRRARKAMSEADIVLYMIDRSIPLDEQEHHEISAMDPVKTILLMNKSDMPQDHSVKKITGFPALETCLLDGHGLNELTKLLESHINIASATDTAGIAERHRLLIEESRTHLRAAITLLEDQNADTTLAAMEIRTALISLGTIIGLSYDNTLLDNVFQKFCIGK